MRRRWARIAACGFVAVLAAAIVPVARGGEPDRAARDQFQALVATIDRLVAAGWEQGGVAPAAPADDAEFLRRVSLDLAGKIPTAGEARDFLDDPRPDKRERLVDHLLRSPAHIAHMTNLDRRLLLPEADAGPRQRLLLSSFEAWLREQVRRDLGYDEIVRAILTVPIPGVRSGAPMVVTTTNREPSPLPYILAKEARSENLAASTARVFLGLRLECAQCHNHPFATWTREQFWGYAAFFASLENPRPGQALTGLIREVIDRREAMIPGTTRVVQAAFLDGGAPRWREKAPARVTLAEWMTDPENPYFARAAVNRIWAQLFGVGLVEPIDDMGEANPPSHPELLDALAHAFAHHGFDRKYLLRALVLSRHYQLSSAVTGAAPGTETAGTRLFERMPVRGLSAEQLYDSLVQAIGQPFEERPPNPQAVILGNSARNEFLERFARGEERPTEVQTSILQALALMNGRLVSSATRVEQGPTLAALADAPFLDTAGRVEALFLAALSRRPKPGESARLVAYVDRGGPAAGARRALGDVFWALLNSPEFLLNH